MSDRSESDKFMDEVAEELAREDLTHDAKFQEFCNNSFGLLTPGQAAESWERDYQDAPRPY